MKHTKLRQLIKEQIKRVSLKEDMSDEEIRDLAMKELPNFDIPEELVEPAIEIFIDGFRKMEYYDIDPTIPIEYQRISPWRLEEFQEIIEKMQTSIRDLVDGYIKDNPDYKFESKMKHTKLRKLIREQIEFQKIEEGFGDQVGAAFKGIGQGISSILSTIIGAVVIAGILIIKGAMSAVGGVFIIAGVGASGLMWALEKFVLIPKVNATLKRLSEDEEVMAIAMKPTAKGLRKVAAEKLTTSERVMVGNFIKDNVTRDMLGVSSRYRGGKKVGVKSQTGPGLKPFDQTPLGYARP